MNFKACILDKSLINYFLKKMDAVREVQEFYERNVQLVS
ncbi:MAG: hypothetical protein JWN37_241 [Candidatus Nomurabacteria bacterium]|nr:hypothetical protein [Candidatus Nomurabacteria bacterium]